MADLNFPNPGVQQQYTFVGKTWNWDGQRWAFASSGSGITKLNNLTNSVQNFLIGYSGAFPNIVSSGTDHTFNFPIASTGATGLVNTSSQTFAGDKTFASTTNATYIGVGGVVVHGGIAISGNAAIGGSAIFTNTSNTNTIAFRSGNQANTLTYILPTANPTSGQVLSASAPASGVVTLSWANDQTGSGGLASLNGETASTQLFATSTTGTDFTITSSAGTHTFNIPIAGSGSTGLITTLAQTIAGAKTFSSSIVGNLSGTATTAENVVVTATARNVIHYLTFTNQATGTGLGLTTSNAGVGFTVNPALGTLAATTFVGNLSGTAATVTNFYGSLVGTANTSRNSFVNSTTISTDHYLIFANASSGSGLALSTSAVGAGLTFNPATSSLSAVLFTGTAVTSQNVSVSPAIPSSNFYVTFTNASTGSGLALSTSTVGAGLTFNPATSSLSAVLFTGTATTARNVSVTTTALSGIHYLTFTNAQSGTGLGLTTSNAGVGFTVNPALGTLAATTFLGNLSGTAATITNIYGNLVGTATTAQNANVVSADSTGNHYLLFSPTNGGSGVALSVDGGLTFVPTTNILTTTVFSGNLSATGATITTILNAQGDVSLGDATADTVTFNARVGSSINPSSNNNYDLGTTSLRWRNGFVNYLTGTAFTSTDFYGNLSGTATTAQNVVVTSTGLNVVHQIIFANAQSGTGLGLTTSNVGVGFTVNPALGTMSATTFLGNHSGTAATFTNFYGTLNGNVTGTATTSQNVSVSTAIPSSNFYVTFTSASTGSGLALSTSSVGAGLTFNPATSSLSAVLFTGTATTSRNSVVTTTNVSTDHHILFANASSGSGLALSTSSVGAGLTFNPATSSLSAVLFTGTASTSRNVSLTTTALNGIHYLTFANAQTGSGLALTTSNAGVGFTVNPALNTLSAGTFIGNISGTAATVTNFYGSLNGNVTGTATTSQNVHVATTTISTNHHILFTNAQNGTGLGLSTSNVGIGLTFNPATSTLSAVLFTGTANTSRNSVINSTTISSDHYLVFANASSGSGLALSTSTVGSGLTFNPATSSLSAVIFTGTANTSRNSVVNSTTISADHYLIFANASSGSGLALSTSTVGIGLTFNPATSTLSAVSFTGTATTARNSVITSTTLSTNHYLLFTNASSGSGLALSTGAVGSGLTYNPNTNTLSALFFTGTATTARNVDLTNTTVNGIHYLTFANGTSGSGFGLTTSSVGVGFTVNPALNTMAAGTFLGNVSGSATTSTYITGILRNASYVQGDLLAGASTGNTLTRVPVGANNRYFLKPDSNTQSGLGWSTFAGVFVTSLAPASPTFTLVEGDLWYKVDDGSFNVYYTDVDETAQWVEIVSSGGGTGGGAPAGSNTYVQFNTSGAFDAVPDFTFDINKNQLTISNFPWATPDNGSAALKLLGEGTWFGSADGTFLAINATTAFTGDLIHAKVNNVQKFKVASDGATTIATLNSSGTVYSNGGTLTNSNPSDQNLKENIQSMIGGTSIVNQLNPVSFEWKSGIGGAGTKYGFIAQEVQEIIPDIVSIDSSGTIGLDTVSLIPFLVKSIKEQQETIEQLRAEIQFIKTELGI